MRQGTGVLVVVERNLIAVRAGGAYWWVVVVGVAEPLLYLLAVGWGVGALIGDLPLPGGRTMPYLVFLAPGLLAAAAMTGASGEAMNVFHRTLLRRYDSVLTTPVTPAEVAIGELGWATLRGAGYSALFLVLMGIMGLTSPLLALAALPATLLVGLALGGLVMALTTVLRSWQDLEYLTFGQLLLFLFSGTFVPVASYPVGWQVLVQLTPLYHGVELIRAITTGAVGWGQAGNAGYLLVATAVGLTVVARRSSRLLARGDRTV